jgi:outer membrane protein TolC
MFNKQLYAEISSKAPVRMFFCCLVLFLSGFTLRSDIAFGGSVPDKTITVGVARDGSSPRYTEALKKTKKALAHLSPDAGKVVFKTPSALNCSWKAFSVQKVFSEAMEEESFDIVLLQGGMLTCHAAHLKGGLKKPVISGMIHDPDIIGIPYDKTSGYSLKKNFIFLGLPGQVRSDIKTFREIARFKKLSVVFDKGMVELFPDIRKTLKETGRALGVEITVIPAGKKAGTVLKKLGGETQAVYLTPVPAMSAEQRRALIKGITGKKLPSFSLAGKGDVRKGAFGTLLPDMSVVMPRWTALAVSRVVADMPDARVPVGVKLNEQLIVNKRTAARTGLKSSLEREDVSTLLDIGSARGISPGTAKGDVAPAAEDHIIETDLWEAGGRSGLSYKKAIKVAEKKNIDLAIKEQQIEIIRRERDRELTGLLPQVEADVRYNRIDKNKAEVDSEPKSSSEAGATLSQIIFSDPILSAYRSTSEMVESRRLEREALRLDVAESTESLFIRCLTAEAFLKIDMDNLKLSRDNLSIARMRKEVGVSGWSDVYRWKSKIAREEISVLQQDSALKSFLIDLNRIMGVRQKSEWELREISRGHLDAGFAAASFGTFLEDGKSIKTLKRYAWETALAHSPEMKALKRAIKSREILLRQKKRSFFMPEISAVFDYDHTIDERYECMTFSEEVGLALEELGAPLGAGPSDNDNHWMVGVKASLPLFSGGSRIVDIKRLNAERLRVRGLYTRALQVVEEEVYDAIARLETSLPQIGFARTASEMASKDLKIIKDRYKEGKTSIVELLDAQNNTIIQERSVVLARHRYQRAVTAFLRAVAWRSFVDSKKDHDEWFRGLRERIKKEK